MKATPERLPMISADLAIEPPVAMPTIPYPADVRCVNRTGMMLKCQDGVRQDADFQYVGWYPAGKIDQNAIRL
jgi:hypothetical protein